MLADNGNQLYAKSRISGATDFIFGLDGVAWFERCEIDVIGNGFITASGRSSPGSASHYVFNHAKVYSSKHLVGATYLGRPWKPYSRVTWQNSELSDVVNSAGWTTWNGDSADKAVFGEFKNFGPGADRRGQLLLGKQLTAAVDIKEFFGSNFESEWWVDKAYL